MNVRLASLALAVLLSIGAAACGDSGTKVEIGTPGSGGSSGEPSATGGPGSTDGGLTDCGAILKAYGSLATTALKGQDAAAAAQKTLEGLESKLPADLQDDLTVVADAFGTIAKDGVVQGASALTTSEFVEANKNILGYLREDCLPG